MKKRLCMLLALALVLGLTVTVGAAAGRTFVSDWACSEVAKADKQGIVPGSLPADYTAPITRAQFCSIAAALYERVMGCEITGRESFADTDDINVEKMAYLGVVNGVGAGRFEPDSALTREQAATLIVRLAEAVGRPLADSTSTFCDNRSISHWALASVGKVQAAGIMNGTGAAVFSPQKPYTIEQSIVTMLRVMQVLETQPQTHTEPAAENIVIAGGSCGSNVNWSLDNSGRLTIFGTGAMRSYSYNRSPWYSYRTRITSAVVEEGVTRLTDHTFRACVNLTSVSLPKSITAISHCMFSGCTALTTVDVPDGVMTIESFAFDGCTSLTAVDLPESVTVIEDYAFRGCSSLTTVKLPEALTEIGVFAFSGCALTSINLPAGITDGYGWILAVCSADVGVYPAGTFAYTVKSVKDVERAAEDMLGRWPTTLCFYVPAQQAAEFEGVIKEFLAARFSNYTCSSYVVQCDLGTSNDSVAFVAKVDHWFGMDVLPWLEGSADVIGEDSVALYERAQEILSEIITDDMGEYETVKAIHDYLVNHTKYVGNAARKGQPFGPIVDGQAVCEGYAHAFQVLCEMCDIDCLYVSGIARGAHGWNKVKVDGVWYNVDVTWDDPIGGSLRYDYFLISDRTLAGDHSWDKPWLPVCGIDHPSEHTKKQVTTTTAIPSTTTTTNTNTNTNTDTGTDTESDPVVQTTGRTVYYFDTYVDSYGFTWVEEENSGWALYIQGKLYHSVEIGAQALMAGVDIARYTEINRLDVYSEHSPDEQTAEDIAPRMMGG